MIMITMSKYALIVLGLAVMTSTITTTMTKESGGSESEGNN